MDKFSKTLLLLSIQVVIVLFFLSYSERTEIGTTIIFPFVFAITFYLIVAQLFSINFKSKKYDLLMALFIGGIALFSTSIGYHYSANTINNMILTFGGLEEAKLQERVYFMDEYFSHWLMFGGLFSMALASIIWGYLYYNQEKKEKPIVKKERELVDIFLLTFFGSTLGAILGYLSISGNVVKHGLVAVAILLPLILIKFKELDISKKGREALIYSASAISSYLAVVLVFHFVFRVDYLCTLLFI